MIPITIVGVGAMGEALIHGLKDHYTISAYNAGDNARLRAVASKTPITPCMDDASRIHALGVCAAVIVACKPHHVPEALRFLAPHIRPHTVVISVAAGVSIASIASYVPDGQPIVRAMPNTSCALRKGVTAWCARAHVPPMIRTLFDTLGFAIEVQETHMHAVTAISGSGPAYVYAMMEALIAAAERLGIPDAHALVAHTAAGAAQRVLEGAQPKHLRTAVTSPNGTTAAALAVLAPLGGLIDRAVDAAIARGQEMEAEIGGTP
jgi:pyrroline-5-carboxylate reductase